MGSSIRDMKKLLSVEWDVPPPFQTILRDSLETLDSDLITGDAVYTVVISFENGCKKLPSLVDNEVEEVKVQALKYLAKSGLDNALAMATAKHFLGDANIKTRVEAMQTIAAVAEVGDQHAIRLLASSIENEYDFDFDEVMMASIKGLAKIGSGDVYAIEALQTAATVSMFHVLFENISEVTRDAAIQALTDMGVEVEDPATAFEEEEDEEEEDEAPNDFELEGGG